MFRIGPLELLLILIILIMIFGAGRLVELGSALGKMVREFRRARAGEDEKREQ